jgi:hypothetical protein
VATAEFQDPMTFGRIRETVRTTGCGKRTVSAATRRPVPCPDESIDPHWLREQYRDRQRSLDDRTGSAASRIRGNEGGAMAQQHRADVPRLVLLAPASFRGRRIELPGDHMIVGRESTCASLGRHRAGRAAAYPCHLGWRVI